ncbi:MAG: hypothetical protein ACFFC7_12150 [Candidatus Hermodarchaeota archaeon]
MVHRIRKIIWGKFLNKVRYRSFVQFIESTHKKQKLGAVEKLQTLLSSIVIESSKKEEETNVCSECGGILIQTNANIVCYKCGVVVDVIYQLRNTNVLGSPGPSFKEDFGVGLSNYGSYMGRYIPNMNNSSIKNWEGKPFALDSKEKKRLWRLKKFNDIYSKKIFSTTIIEGLALIERVLSYLEASSQIGNVTRVYLACYEQIKEQKMGYNTEIVAGALYTVCQNRSIKTVLRFKEIIQAFSDIEPLKTVRGKIVVKISSAMKNFLGWNKEELIIKSHDFYIEKVIYCVIHDNEIRKKLESQLVKAGWREEEFIKDLRFFIRKICERLPSEENSGDPYLLACAIVSGAVILVSTSSTTKNGKNIGQRKRGFFSQSLIAKTCGTPDLSLRAKYIKTIKPIVVYIKNELAK